MMIELESVRNSTVAGLYSEEAILNLRHKSLGRNFNCRKLACTFRKSESKNVTKAESMDTKLICLTQSSGDAEQQSDGNFATQGRSLPASSFTSKEEGAGEKMSHKRTFKPAYSKRQQLTAEEAAEIFSLRPKPAKGIPSKRGSMIHCKSIGPKFGVSPKTIRDIWRGRTWTEATKHLWTPEEHIQITTQNSKLDRNLKLELSDSSDEELALHPISTPRVPNNQYPADSQADGRVMPSSLLHSRTNIMSQPHYSSNAGAFSHSGNQWGAFPRCIAAEREQTALDWPLPAAAGVDPKRLPASAPTAIAAGGLARGGSYVPPMQALHPTLLTAAATPMPALAMLLSSLLRPSANIPVLWPPFGAQQPYGGGGSDGGGGGTPPLATLGLWAAAGLPPWRAR